MTKVIAALLFAAVSSSACMSVHKPDPGKAELIRNTFVTCRTASECDMKWSAGVMWVNRHAGYKVRVSTPDRLETFGPFPHDIVLSVKLMKVRIEKDLWQIVPTVVCDNKYGCQPDNQEATLDLMRTMNQVKP